MTLKRTVLFIWGMAIASGLLLGCRGHRKAAINLEDYSHPVRVACIGDSITFGAEVENRDENNYPAVLGKRLGAQFVVRNFGVNGATLQRAGDNPYWKLPQLEEVDNYRPDLILIMLGTNDTKPQNWKGRTAFEDDARAFVEHFQALPTKPKIWVCLPVPVYGVQWGINDETLFGQILPAWAHVAQQKKLAVIDLYDALSNRPDLFPDKVHPNAKGAEIIAHTVEMALMPQR
jgi:lysophospholipase L1-like esterase